MTVGWEQKGCRRYAVQQHKTKTVMKKSRSAPLRIIKYWELRWRRWRFNLWLVGLGPARDLLHFSIYQLLLNKRRLFFFVQPPVCVYMARLHFESLLVVWALWYCGFSWYGLCYHSQLNGEKKLCIVPLAAPFSAFGGLYQCFEIPNMKPVL